MKDSLQTSPEKVAKQGRQHGSALSTLSQKPEPQTNLGPVWFLALLSGLFIHFLQPYVCGSTYSHGTLQPTPHALSQFPKRQLLNCFTCTFFLSICYRLLLEMKYQCRQIIHLDGRWPFSSDVRLLCSSPSTHLSLLLLLECCGVLVPEAPENSAVGSSCWRVISQYVLHELMRHLTLHPEVSSICKS